MRDCYQAKSNTPTKTLKDFSGKLLNNKKSGRIEFSMSEIAAQTQKTDRFNKKSFDVLCWSSWKCKNKVIKLTHRKRIGECRGESDPVRFGVMFFMCFTTGCSRAKAENWFAFVRLPLFYNRFWERNSKTGNRIKYIFRKDLIFSSVLCIISKHDWNGELSELVEGARLEIV